MTVAVRVAPSPTGRLHVGNIRTALINWLFARRHGGTFLLRIDDTDEERSTRAYEEAIEQDLGWLGLRWDRFARQSDRLRHYAEAAQKLTALGRLYPCYETPEELELKRKMQLARKLPPVYDRAALKLSAEDKRTYESAGRLPHYRFLLSDRPVEWQDLVRGTVRFEPGHLSDPVLMRADGRPLYMLASVVDDLELGISHVIRGEDHVANTAPHIELFAALGGDPATLAFAHLPLLTDASGAGFSKRLGSLSVGDLRASGVEPMALNSLLAKLGTSDSIEPRHSLDELVAEFDISHFSRSTPKFDLDELMRLNARLLHSTSFEAVAGRLEALGLSGVDRGFWEAVRGNLSRLDDAAIWWRVVHGELAPLIEDADFARQAAALLPSEPWDGGTWAAWTESLKRATRRNGKALFHPLRLALTGRERGPELAALLPLIGRARARARLNGEAA
ncbi:MAG TPA: glutamate--tRNA ligase [Alphaproteobacteria bacterium]|nr:glutamate--tRNA ligase [Alphaproteobacteria bacterium]